MKHTIDSTIMQVPHASIFREYDMRGIVGKTLFEHDANAIARAFATYLGQQGLGNKVAVGYDGRKSSPDFEQAIVNGLLASGCEVVRIGLGPTPMLYYAVKALELDAGLMVTGSHNPPSHNGIKAMLADKPFYGDAIQALYHIIQSGEYIAGKGVSVDKDITQDYTQCLVDAFQAPACDLKVAWDAGNGAAGEIMRKVCDHLPGTHILLNEVIDGTFPNHHPDPTVPKNLEQLIAAVKKDACDFGVAFDGDGDRIGAVDAEGNIIWGDQLLVLFGRALLQSQPGATVIADVKASQLFFDEIAKAGGNALMWKTGHSLIKAKMAETGAPLAGEMSGHVFFADRYYGFDDGLYAAVRLLEVAAMSNHSITEMLAALPVLHNTPEMRIECPEDRKFVVIEEVKERLKSLNANYSDVDGVRVLTEDGWWLLRASNTQAAIVARCEASTKAGLERLKASVSDMLQQSGIALSE